MKITKKQIKKLTLETNNELEKHVLEHGCGLGMVSELIYYADTKAFYIKYMEEIEEIVEDLDASLGESVLIHAKFPLYNWLAWLGYEETIRKIANEKFNLYL